MTLLAYPLVAMAGALAGTIAHEATHAVAAVALGELDDIGWRGGLGGGPYVDFRADSRWRSEVVRKAPLAFGLVALAVVVVTYTAPTLAWVAAAAFALGLGRPSPEDLSRRRAQASA